MVQTSGGKGLQALKEKIAQIGKKQVRIGFPENATYPDGTKVAYVATIQEFGSGPIPPRPFLRPTIEAQREAWKKTLQRGYKAVIAESITLDDMLSQFGMLAAGQVKMTISQITTPPLSPSTIRSRQSKKKTSGVSVKPLVDTGYLISQVGHEVIDV